MKNGKLFDLTLYVELTRLILKLTTGNLINKMKAGRLDINSTISLKTALEKKKSCLLIEF